MGWLHFRCAPHLWIRIEVLDDVVYQSTSLVRTIPVESSFWLFSCGCFNELEALTSPSTGPDLVAEEDSKTNGNERLWEELIWMKRAERSKSGWRRWLRTVRQIRKCIRGVYSMLFSLFLAVKRKVYFEWRPQDRSPSLDSLTLSLALKSASKNLQGAWKTFASGLLRAFYSY